MMGAPSKATTNKMFGGITPNKKELKEEFERFWNKNAVNKFLENKTKDDAYVEYIEDYYFGE